GTSRADWHTNIPTYSRIEYRNIYDGIDVAYYGNQNRLEYDLIVSPKADPSRAVMVFEGAESIKIDAEGDLTIETGNGELVQHKPIAYQEVGNKRENVECRYKLLGSNRVAFELGSYDKNRRLIIDPVLNYASYLGGIRGDVGVAVAVDSRSNLYITGRTDSVDFPVNGNVFQPMGDSIGDAFVTKLDPTGRVIFSTFIGGRDIDFANGIAVDSNANIYITGTTRSIEFPVTPNALQNSLNAGFDAFITVLSSTGNSLLFSSYFGGSLEDGGADIAIDSRSNIYVGGSTRSVDFPVSMNSAQNANRGFREGFVVALSPVSSSANPRQIYSTYLGGAGDDLVRGIAVDRDGTVLVAGSTRSDDFPVVSAFQSMRGGAPTGDGFLTRINPTGTSFSFSTFFGGSDEDFVADVAIDSTGSAYITGGTRSLDMPIRNAFQSSNRGGSLGTGIFAGPSDAFIAKFTPNGQSLVFATYLGGSDFDEANSIAVDRAGNVYVTGTTASDDFPLMRPVQMRNGSSGQDLKADTFVTKLTFDGQALTYSTFFGGSRIEAAPNIAIDPAGNGFITGVTTSMDFPVRTPIQNIFGGGDVGILSGDAFVLRIDETASYNLSITPQMLTLRKARKTNVTINMTTVDGFVNPVTVTAPNTSQIRINIKPTSAIVDPRTGLTFSLKARRQAQNGQQMLTFTGTDANGLTRTVNLMVMITD
ncbi:MAG: SBBP repeat-containing protein, partial [Blastocatellia bacterium]|nr:SBBP repeat-containing protein [Blastocatellia bacterium]